MKVADISGMDPARKQYGYEWGCQVIAARALRWMREHSIEREIPKHTEFKNVCGLAIPENEAARQMETYIFEHPKLIEYGATGAMMQYSINHAKFRFLNGDEKYLAEFSKDDPGRLFEFNESDAFPERQNGTA